MADDNAKLLSASDLHKRYRMGGEDLHVLRGVSMKLLRGEWLAIVGASGSGKSTLLHLLGGLDRADNGEITFEGRDITALRGSDLDAYRAHSVGFVFQFYHLLPELNALENVMVGAMIRQSVFGWLGDRKAVRQRALDLLDRLGLGERLKHRPNKLSGGERQRVAIARALINEPAVLFADEPTGNLDAATGHQILDVFADFHKTGQTIVMVTHDEKVAHAADRVVSLEAGRLQKA